MSDEMKKWMPYKSLVEQVDFLKNRLYEKGKQEKPIISEEEAARINSILVNYQGEVLLVTYYQDGYLYKYESVLSKIDKEKKRIYFTRTDFIDFKNIIHVEIKDNKKDDLDNF